NPKNPPTPADITRWIKDLGSDDFATRENASKMLRAAGQPAEAALERAYQEGEAEVKRRAGEILEDFRWGIYPDTPAKVVELVGAYKNALDLNAKLRAARDLFELGGSGQAALLRIARMEPDEVSRRQIFQQLSQNVPRAAPGMLLEGQYAFLEELLEFGAASGRSEGAANLAAYWFLRGKADEKIKEYEARFKTPSPAKWAGEVIVYLNHAKGDRQGTLKAIAACAQPQLF